jgi:RNA polymerase sigma-70 factor (ECF subfamily)
VLGFLSARVLRRPDLWRLVPTRANGQPAFGVYSHNGSGYQASGIQVLTCRDGRISRITAFNDPALISTFGLAPGVVFGDMS